jgi:chitodextrinase
MGAQGIAQAQTPAQVGQWAGPFSWPLVAIHMVLTPTGQVLVFDGPPVNGGESARLWNPADGSFTSVPNDLTDLFCVGQAVLEDGRIFTAGGHIAPGVGLVDGNIFDFTTKRWTQTAPMAFPRWYPTVTPLPDGRMLVTSGSDQCETCFVEIPEVYDLKTNTWTQLTNADLPLPLYPHMFVLSDGRVLASSASLAPIQTQILNVASLTWTVVDPSIVDGHSALMYRTDKIMKSGTAADVNVSTSLAARTTYVLDMTKPVPAWRSTAPMAFPRAFHNLTMLPDGTVLATGGGRTVDGVNSGNAVFAAELWSPATETWTTMSSMQTPRLYHGTALLLPDARVLVAGSGRYGPTPQLSAEIYSPPYLFKGARPTIASAPSTAIYSQSIFVGTPDASQIASISLIGIGAVTHAFNAGQRYLELGFTSTAGGLNVQMPAGANLAPPGYYMLFLVNSAGVPSTASMVMLGADSDGDGLPDAWEARFFGNLAQSATGDPDGDGLTNAQEFARHTNPAAADTDGDGYSDGAEVAAGTDPQNSASAPGPRGPIAAYAMSEGAGSSTADGSGNLNTGILVGATWTTQGRYGNALSFNGTSSFVSVADFPILTLGSQGTLEAQVKLNAVNRWNGVIAKGDSNSSATQNYAIEITDTNRVRCILGTGSAFLELDSTTTVAAGQFYHVACTWNATTVSLYINGALNASRAQSITPVGNDSPLVIGQFGGNSDRLNGIIDEVRVYNRALTLAEIQTDMNTPIGGTPPPPDATPPTAPSNLTATAVGTGQINLAWSAATDNVGVTGYLVERCQNAGCSSFTQIATAAATSFNNTGLQAGTTYSYRVRATDAANNLSVYSNTATAATQAADGTPPSAPSNLTATAVSTTQINLAWSAATDNVGVTGYLIERCQDAGCSGFIQIATTAATSFNNTGLQAGTTYSYRVRATDAANNLSAYSNTATTATQTPPVDTTPPTAPSSLTATAVSTAQINLAWSAANDNVGVTGYLIERCQDAGCSGFIQIATTAATSFNNTGLQAGTTYSYRVRATDAANNLSAYSNTATAATPSSPPPTQSLMAAYAFNEGTGATTADGSGNNNNATVTSATWTTQGRFGNALSFNGTSAFISTPDSASLDLGANGTIEASIRLTAVNRWNSVIAKGNANSSAAHNYAIEITDTNRVRCILGNGSAFLELDSTATVATGQFYHVACTWNATTVALYIDGALNTSRAQSITPAGNTSPLFIGQFGGNSDRLNGIIDEVRVYNRALTLAEIQTDMNTPVGGTPPPPDTTPPAAPSNLTATAVGTTQINLAWSAATDNVGVTGYLIERCQDPGCSSFAQIATTTTTSFNNTGLQTGTAYSYRVRATDAANNLSVYSNTATAATGAPDTTPPSAPANLTATAVSTAQINLAWSAATDNVGVVGYLIERCQDAGCAGFAQIATAAITSFNNTGLPAGTTYSYRVRATDAANNLSGYSDTATTATQSVPPPTQGLVAAYAFNEGAGTTTADSSGNANHVTLNGAAWTTQGRFGNALTFNGSTAFASTADAPTLDLGANGTIEASVRLSAVNRWSSVLAKGNANDSAAHNYAIEITDTNRVRCILGNGSAFLEVDSIAAVASGQFYHLACTWNGTTVALYINGVLNTSTAQPFAPVGNSAPLSIGQFGGNSDRLNGIIDEVRIYNRALSAAEIQTDMNSPIQ